MNSKTTLTTLTQRLLSLGYLNALHQANLRENEAYRRQVMKERELLLLVLEFNGRVTETLEKSHDQD